MTPTAALPGPLGTSNPYVLFGTANNDLATSALALPAQAPSGSLTLGRLCRMMNDYDANAVRKALVRLEDEGLVTCSVSRGLAFSLNRRYAAFAELSELLTGIARARPEYRIARVWDPPARRAV